MRVRICNGKNAEFFKKFNLIYMKKMKKVQHVVSGKKDATCFCVVQLF